MIVFLLTQSFLLFLNSRKAYLDEISFVQKNISKIILMTMIIISYYSSWTIWVF